VPAGELGVSASAPDLFQLKRSQSASMPLPAPRSRKSSAAFLSGTLDAEDLMSSPSASPVKSKVAAAPSPRAGTGTLRAVAAATRLSRLLPGLPEEADSHRYMLRNAFPFQGYIEATEHRAISLTQLRQVIRFVKEHCHRWQDSAPPELSKTPGSPLSIDSLNLHHLSTWVIKPATRTSGCSFVELLTAKPQLPAWYVSHWWGERHIDFVRCVGSHAGARGLPLDTNYWVCAYANRLNSPDADINEDPMKTSFFKAMQIAKFNTLLIINEETEQCAAGVPFQRIWCAFELFVCLDQPSLPLDVATCKAGEVVLLTPGLTKEEEDMEVNPGAGTNAALARAQQGLPFPSAVIAAGLALRLEKAGASVDEDRIRILNCIAGNPLRIRPAKKHQRYNEINCRLRSLFALACWRGLLAKGWQQQPLAQLAEALRSDRWRKVLDVSLAGCNEAREEDLFLFLRSLPYSLQVLKIDFRGMGISDEFLGMLPVCIPSSVEGLSVDLSNCREVSDGGIFSLTKGLQHKVKQLQLKLASTKVSKEIQEACSLEDLRRCLLISSDTLQDAAAEGLPGE